MNKTTKIDSSIPVTMYKEDVDMLDSLIERTGQMNSILIEEGRKRAEWSSRKGLILIRKEMIHKFSGAGKESFYSRMAKAHENSHCESIMMYQRDCEWFDELAKKMNLFADHRMSPRKAQIVARKELFHRLVCFLDDVLQPIPINKYIVSSVKGVKEEGNESF